MGVTMGTSCALEIKTILDAANAPFASANRLQESINRMQLLGHSIDRTALLAKALQARQFTPDFILRSAAPKKVAAGFRLDRDPEVAQSAKAKSETMLDKTEETDDPFALMG